MKIINPLYDNAFKYLMQNEKIAKRVLEVILNQPILELIHCQQERSELNNRRSFALFRLNSKAIVLDEQGKRQTVQIDLQKSRLNSELVGFQLGLWPKSGEFAHVQASQEKEHYSHSKITIYILGYNITEIPYPAVKIDHSIVNAITNEPLNLHSDFIDKLIHHRSHILQVCHLPQEAHSRLEQFMELFNQDKIAEEPYFLDLDPVSEEFSDIARYLNEPLADEKFCRHLRAEDEIDLIFDQQERKHLRKIKEVMDQTEKIRQRTQRYEKDPRQREEEERRQRERAQQREQAMAYKLARQMKRANLPVEEIVAESGLTAEAIGQIT